MRGCLQLRLDAVCDFYNEFFGAEHLEILEIEETDDNQLDNAHQYYNHILLPSRALKTVIADQPPPAHREENKCNDQDTLSEGRLHGLLNELVLELTGQVFGLCAV